MFGLVNVAQLRALMLMRVWWNAATAGATICGGGSCDRRMTAAAPMHFRPPSAMRAQ
jgi:hypothetical protein